MDTALFGDGGVHCSGSRSTSLHSLPWLKLIVPLDGGWVTVKTDERRLRVQGPLLTAANARTTASTEGENIAFFLPQEAAAHQITDALDGPVSRVCGSRGRALRSMCHALDLRHADDARDAANEVVRILAPSAGGRSLDARVEAARERLRSRERPQIGPLARSLKISESRLSHLFTRQMGISMRTYTLFRRLIDAYRLKPQLKNLAAVAFAAGFSDHAHLTRTARRFLGQPASYGGRIVQA